MASLKALSRESIDGVMAGLAATARGRIEPGLELVRAALTRERSAAPDAALAVAVRSVVVSRLVVWVAGLTALAIFGRNADVVAALDPNHASAPFHSAAANFLLAPAARWDSVFYLVIAHVGYYSYQSSGMFPFYPVLIHVGTMLFRSELIVGLAISVASITAALTLLYRLLVLDLDERVARTTVWLVALFPVSFFFSAVYTESLFLLLTVGSIYAARLDRWGWAGVLAALASATKSAGVALVIPLVVMYLFGPRTDGQPTPASAWWRPRYRVTASIAWLILVPAGMVAFLAYLGITHGQPFATFTAQTRFWGHHFAGPFGGLAHAAVALPHDLGSVLGGTGRPVGLGDPLTWNAHELIDLGFLALAAVGLIAAVRRIPISYSVYGLALLAQPLSVPTTLEPLQSIPRYVMVIFPLYIGWAILIDRHRLTRASVLGMSTALLAVFSGLWAMWAWVA